MKRTYWDGTRKRRASDGGYCVNLLQSKAERQAKAQTLRALGVETGWAARLRDWRYPNISKWLRSNGQDVDFFKLVEERLAWNAKEEANCVVPMCSLPVVGAEVPESTSPATDASNL